MASDEQRNGSAEPRTMSAAVQYEQRAAWAIRRLIAGRHADKLTAIAFGCSVRTAQNLRAGHKWTIDRLSQASAVLGAAFDAALHPSSDAVHEFEMTEIAERLARLEARWNEMAGSASSRLSPAPGGAPDEASRGKGFQHGPEIVGGGAPAQREGDALGEPARSNAGVTRR